MDIWKTVAIAASTLAFATGCATTDPAPAATTIQVGLDGSFVVVDEDGNPTDSPEANFLAAMLAQSMANSQTLPEEEIWAKDETGDFTHIQSGGICPEVWNTFELKKKSINQPDGSDVSCNYQDSQAAFTFYFFKNSQSALEHSKGVIELIKVRSPRAKPVEFVNPQFSKSQMYGLALKGPDSSGKDIRDAVLVTDNDGWQIKLRMTYYDEVAAAYEMRAQLMLLAQMDQINPQGYQPDAKDKEPKQVAKIQSKLDG